MDSIIPLIDLAKLDDPDPAKRREVIELVRGGLETVGFLLVKNHGVPQQLVDRAHNAGLEFFRAPEPDKLKVLKPSKTINRGFMPNRDRLVGKASTPGVETLPALQEGFAIGPLDISDEYYRSGSKALKYAPNKWPDSPADFQTTMRDYYDHMERVFQKVMSMMAVALDLPPGFFDRFLTYPSSTLRLVYYPALDREPLPGEERAGTHTDTGAVTILHIDETTNGGLQVKLRSGEWIDVHKTPGAFIINIGDMMAQWTNDKWVSTLHRVANPCFVDGKTSDRLSIVHFCQTNYDTLVECLPTCTSADNPPKYPPVIAGEYSRLSAAKVYGYKLPEPADA